MRRIRVPGDKSVTQRALIFASLASGESRLRGLLPGEDPQATAAALRALGVDIPPFDEDEAEVRIQGVGLRGLQEPHHDLNFENSGTGARLMLGVLAGQPMNVDRDRGRVAAEPSHGTCDRPAVQDGRGLS